MAKPEFDDIDTSFYIKFNDYLLALNLSVNTISNQWKHIKAIMKKAQILLAKPSLGCQGLAEDERTTDLLLGVLVLILIRSSSIRQL